MDRKGSSRTDSCIAVIIPTRNRPVLLGELIKNLSLVELKPYITVVVDSSDSISVEETQYTPNHIIFIKAEVKSASVQRNIGIDFLLSSQYSEEIELICFLDDDVLVPKKYFDVILENFMDNQEIVGFSGVAQTTHNMQRKKFRRNIVSDWIGISGDAGTLTKAAVNISPVGLHQKSEVEWLIGCSTWRKEIFANLRFEEKFEGQSIFEDVIFSARARKSGKLLCDPELVLEHSMAPIGRDTTRHHYVKWVENRNRIFDYDISGVSRLHFCILNIALLFESSLKAPFSYREREKCFGIIIGIWRSIRLSRN